MAGIFGAIIGEQLGFALILYPITWLIIRRKDGEKVKLDSFSWHFFGFLVVGFGVGIIRFLFIFIVGIQPILQLEEPVFSYSFVFILPILASIGISKLNMRFNRKVKSANNEEFSGT